MQRFAICNWGTIKFLNECYNRWQLNNRPFTVLQKLQTTRCVHIALLEQRKRLLQRAPLRKESSVETFTFFTVKRPK